VGHWVTPHLGHTRRPEPDPTELLAAHSDKICGELRQMRTHWHSAWTEGRSRCTAIVTSLVVHNQRTHCLSLCGTGTPTSPSQCASARCPYASSDWSSLLVPPGGPSSCGRTYSRAARAVGESDRTRSLKQQTCRVSKDLFYVPQILPLLYNLC